MNFTKFVSVPLTSVFCSTCMQWGGARVTKDGFSNTCANFKGSCKSTLDMFEHNNLKDMQKKATYADCKYWVPINCK